MSFLILNFSRCCLIDAVVGQFDVFTPCQSCQTAILFHTLITRLYPSLHPVDGTVKIFFHHVEGALHLLQFSTYSSGVIIILNFSEYFSAYTCNSSIKELLFGCKFLLSLFKFFLFLNCTPISNLHLQVLNLGFECRYILTD